MSDEEVNVEYINTDDNVRVWPGIQTADGRTLELAPNETAKLALPASFVDPYLKPKRVKKETKAEATKREEQEAAEAEAEAANANAKTEDQS